MIPDLSHITGKTIIFNLSFDLIYNQEQASNNDDLHL